MQIITVETTSLGNRGYLVHDGAVAVAIDVQRDFERWVNAAEAAGVRITHVLETHIHNDYVTGGYQLAQRESATEYVIPAGSGAAYEAREIHDDEIIDVGMLSVRALHTPGHTENHMSYHITDGNQDAVFTGGGVLFGTVGRSDLLGAEKTQQLAAAQYDSAQRLIETLPDTTRVMPTHGFGSFCSSADGTGAESSTLADERRHNIVFTRAKEDFVEAIIAGLGPYPHYYAHMAPMNQAGPAPVEPLHIHDYSAEAIRAQLQSSNAWVVDVRERRAFAAQHPQQSMGIEMGSSFATYSGWVLPWSDEILLVGDDEQKLRDAYEELSRIGMEQFVTGATSAMQAYQDAGPASSYRVAQFKDLAGVPDVFVLDVRLPADWQGSHVRGAVNIPLHELMSRTSELPDDREIWVHCASGYRASIAAGILDRAGKRPVLIDDTFAHAQELKLTN